MPISPLPKQSDDGGAPLASGLRHEVSIVTEGDRGRGVREPPRQGHDSPSGRHPLPGFRSLGCRCSTCSPRRVAESCGEQRGELPPLPLRLPPRKLHLHRWERFDVALQLIGHRRGHVDGTRLRTPRPRHGGSCATRRFSYSVPAAPTAGAWRASCRRGAPSAFAAWSSERWTAFSAASAPTWASPCCPPLLSSGTPQTVFVQRIDTPPSPALTRFLTHARAMEQIKVSRATSRRLREHDGLGPGRILGDRGAGMEHPRSPSSPTGPSPSPRPTPGCGACCRRWPRRCDECAVPWVRSSMPDRAEGGPS